jgi:hypothetical protein
MRSCMTVRSPASEATRLMISVAWPMGEKIGNVARAMFGIRMRTRGFPLRSDQVGRIGQEDEVTRAPLAAG